MKNIFHSFLALFMALAMVACNDKSSDEPLPPVDDTTPRTVLLYMMARSNLSGNAVSDLAEIKTAVLNGDLGDSRLLIYYVNNSNDPVLCEYDAAGNRQVLKTYDNTSLSVSGQRFGQVIDDAKLIAPAHSYGLIMWGHGTGYVQDGIDDSGISTLSYGGETVNRISYWMNTTTMANVLRNKEFDWIYFDCCFMAGVEVAYELRDVTGHIVASATELPADGMPYDETLRYLMPRKSDLAGAAKATFDYYDSKQGSNRTCTISVINTSMLDNLARVVRGVLAETDGIPAGYTPQAFQTTSDHNLYGWSYYDLQHYLDALTGGKPTSVMLVDMAVKNAVTSAYATPKLWNELPLSNHCGLSTLIIESDNDPQLDKFGYRDLQWWTDVVETRFNKQ